MIAETTFGKGHLQTAGALQAIGQILVAQGKFPEGRARLLQSLDIIASNTCDPETAHTLWKFTPLLEDPEPASVNPETMEALHRMLTAVEKARGPSHPELIPFLYSLGMLLYAQDKNTDALAHFRRALFIAEKTFGKEHPDVAVSWNFIGIALSGEGNTTEALEAFQKALAIGKSNYSKSHPFLQQMHKNIALTLARQSGWHEQEKDSAKGVVVLNCESKGCQLLTPGDWIVAQGEAKIRDAQHLKELVGNLPSGRAFKISVVRNQKNVEFSIDNGLLEADLF